MTGRCPRAEWRDEVDLTTLEHGTLLTVGGRILAGYRDATFVACPDTRTVKQRHVMIVSHRMAIGRGSTEQAAACAPTAIMLAAMTWPAHEVLSVARCRRPACAALFRQADAEEAERMSGDAR